jgi:hypothetical protein
MLGLCIEKAVRCCGNMAERVGFEPTVRFPARSLSRRVLSTAQPPLRGRSTTHSSREREQELCLDTRKGIVSSAFREERLEDGGTVWGEDSSGDLHLMVEAGVGQDLEAGAHGAAFWVVGAVDQARNTRLDDGARAHATGLNGDVEGGIGEAVVGESACSFPQNDNFGMSRRVVVTERAVARASDNVAVVHDHGADRDFSGSRCGARLGQGIPHELDIRLHLRRENNIRKEGRKN